MTPTEAAALLAIAAAYDNRQPNPETAQAWALALDGLRFEDCRDAIVRHFQTSTDWVMPPHVIAEVKRIRSKRITDHPPLTPPPGTEAEQRTWLAEARRRIGDGEAIDCDAAYGELSQRHLPELRELMPRADA